MTLTGTIQNGHVRLDAPCDLPNGTAVTCEADEEFCHPMKPYTEEQLVASIMAIHEKVQRGEIDGMPARDFFDQLEREENERALIPVTT